ncbi:MAG TPA: alpha-amylase family glycosyl hydrolase [bacterium]|nr:alpha-amylase family glycosyl hydrolase [bacterium]
MRMLFPLVLFSVVFIAACDKNAAKGPCDGITCSGHGTCDATSGRAVCICDENYHPNGLLECIADTDPCEGVDCDDWETCVNGACDPLPGKCNDKDDCAANEECEEHDCVSHDPCEGVDCSGHGECTSGYGYGDEVFCDCEENYHAVGLECLPGAPADDDSLFSDDELPPDADTVTDPCVGVSCKEWEVCVEGDCALSPGRCVKTGDCGDDEVCDTAAHDCIVNPCTGVACGNGGICSLDGITPVCNCPNGYMTSGLSCITDTATPIDWCNVQWPPTMEATLGAPPVTVYSQLYQPGITDGGKPESATVRAELGYGVKLLTYPVIQTDLSWVAAEFNITGAGDFGNNHEYMAEFPTDRAGLFNYIYRYTLNDGASWTYCDTAGKITSASIAPGVATISGGSADCGGLSCFEWETCDIDTCVPLPGRCNVVGDCDTDTETCDTASHTCVDKNGMLVLDTAPELTADGYTFTVRYVGPGELVLATSKVTLNGAIITPSLSYEGTTKSVTVSKSGLSAGKYSYLFSCKNDSGSSLPPLFVPIWLETTPFGWRDAFLYQIMNDRFLNGDMGNDQPVGGVETIRNWMGGDWAGIIEKLEDDYFTDLGVNALWISSPVKNTEQSGIGMTDGLLYSGYHSYWPIATGWTDAAPLSGLSSPIEDHFGTDAELRELVNKAHAKGIRVLVDLVANHVHTDSPLWTAHKNDGWFNMAPSGKPANSNGGYTCGWDLPEDCWFTDYLPDLNYDEPAVMDAVMDHAAWLVQAYDLDGFRLDAVKHMPMAFSTTIRTRVTAAAGLTGIPFYMVGETFDGDRGLIAAYVGHDRLDGQFDFPLYFKVRDVLLQHTAPLSDLASFVVDNDDYYQQKWGGAIMSNFMGNHDVIRALTYAGGDHARVRMAQTFLLTSPAIPLIYQGDDIGMEGNADPDNRRMMVFEPSLSTDQRATLAHLKKLGTARKAHPALRTGTRTTLITESNVWAYAMKKDADEAIVILNRGAQTQRQLSTTLTGTLTDVISGGTAVVSGGKITVTVPAMTSAVYTK